MPILIDMPILEPSYTDLLARDGFTMVWDDLTSPQMRGAFNTIAKEMRETYADKATEVSLELFQGWVGGNEFLHPIGIVRHGSGAS